MEEARMMVDESDEGEIIINEVDGLPSLHDSGYSDVRGIDFDDSNISFDELINDEDLPTSLIVTSIDTSVFHDEELKVILFTYLFVITKRTILIFCIYIEYFNLYVSGNVKYYDSNNIVYFIVNRINWNQYLSSSEIRLLFSIFAVLNVFV